MANDITSLSYKILARAMGTLRQTCKFPKAVNSDFSSEAAAQGRVINVPVPTAVGTQNVTASKTDDDSTDITIPTVPITMDYWRKTNPIALTDKEALEMNANATYIPMSMNEGIKALANYVNGTIAGRYISEDMTQGIYGVVGTAGTTPFASAVTAATSARALLNKQLCPRDARSGFVDYDAEANMLALAQFSDAEKTGDPRIKLEGEIGRKYGINWMAEDGLITHTAGTINSGSGARNPLVNNSGGYAQANTTLSGNSTINIDATSLTGTIKVGDIISFAGHSQTYCVTANTASVNYSAGVYTAASNAIAGLTFFPALQAAVADNEVITVLASHKVNLVFHRDAFAFANRPLEQSTVFSGLGGSVITSMTDPLTGLTMRLEVKRQNKRVAFEFDMLWGVNLVRPQLAVRLLG